MPKIVKHENEKVNTKVRIWVLNPEKSTNKKFYMPVKRQVKTKVTTKI